jgi:dUTP pyrophosphatase
MTEPKLRLRRLPHFGDLPLPAYKSEAAAGLDLCAAMPEDDPVLLRPGARRLVETGLVIELPPGSEGQIRPRSGLALEHGVTVLNAPGTIDADYRGEVKVLLVNLGADPVTIRRGMRIAQLVVAGIRRVTVEPVADLSATERGSGGFGSTGSS